MDIQVIPQTINYLQFRLTEEQARAILVDAREFQDELRTCLAPLGAARQKHVSIAIETKSGLARRGRNGNGNGNGHSPKVSARKGPGSYRSKQPMKLLKCDLCGKVRHRKDSACPRNPARINGAGSSFPSSAGASTEN